MPTVLALDIASGGAAAGLVDSDLNVLSFHEADWRFGGTGTQGTLSPSLVLDAVGVAIRGAGAISNPPSALVLSSMMHTLLVTDINGVPRTPVLTWFDRRDDSVEKRFKDQLGRDYPLRTGTYFHPSFPSWKLAELRANSPEVMAKPYRIWSVKSYVQEKLTGSRADDLSTASASGLLNLESGDWDPQTLGVLELEPSALPHLICPADVAGTLSVEAASLLGLEPGLPVVTGGGDGFLATLGSGCERAERVSVTLGTTAAVRRFSRAPETDPALGTFCYRYDRDAFLVGCASNNGGNVLDWARSSLGSPDAAPIRADLPVFIPFLYGERSPFWDPNRSPRFVGVTERHSPQDLVSAVVEGVAFHLAVYAELVSSRLKKAPRALVLSGNGFRLPALAPLLRAVVSFDVRLPDSPGMATLRGAARCGFQALGVSTAAAVEVLMDAEVEIQPYPEASLKSRYERFKEVYYAV